MSEEYKVGHCKPPKHTQFKKGQSGNPKGRPKKKRDGIFATMQEILSRPMTMNIAGKHKKVTMAEAIQLRAVMDALAGKNSAQKLLLQTIHEIERAQTAKANSKVEVTFVGKILDEIMRSPKPPLPNMVWDEIKNDWKFKDKDS